MPQVKTHNVDETHGQEQAQAQEQAQVQAQGQGQAIPEQSEPVELPETLQPEQSVTDIPQLEQSVTDIPQPEQSVTDIPQPEQSVTDIPQPEQPVTDIPQPEQSATNVSLQITREPIQGAADITASVDGISNSTTINVALDVNISVPAGVDPSSVLSSYFPNIENLSILGTGNLSSLFPNTEPPRIIPEPTEAPSNVTQETTSLSPESGVPINVTMKPTLVPETKPTSFPSIFIEIKPTDSPTSIPTNVPTISPTLDPSETPTQFPSHLPTNAPTVSKLPSQLPTVSSRPSSSPTVSPTHHPSGLPSDLPSHVPSQYPTLFPTFSENKTISRTYFQDFRYNDGRTLFSPEERETLCQLYQNYTAQLPSIATSLPNTVSTFCEVLGQRPLEEEAPTPETIPPTLQYTGTESPSPSMQLNFSQSPVPSPVNYTNTTEAISPSETNDTVPISPENRRLRGKQSSGEKHAWKGHGRGLEDEQNTVSPTGELPQEQFGTEPPTGQLSQDQFGTDAFSITPLNNSSIVPISMQPSDQPTTSPSPTITPQPSISRQPSSNSSFEPVPSEDPFTSMPLTMEPSLQPTEQPTEQPQPKTIRNQVEYRMSYISDVIDVDGLPAEFRRFVNRNLEMVKTDLMDFGINVTEVGETFLGVEVTHPPTTSLAPSPAPSSSPIVYVPPTFVPTASPSLAPTTPGPTSFPTPFLVWPTEAPVQPANGIAVGLIVGLILIVVVIVIVACMIFYRRRKWLDQMERDNRPNDVDLYPDVEHSMKPDKKPLHISTGVDSHGDHSPYSPRVQPEGMISPSESLLSGGSLISGPGSIGGESQIEQDTTSNLRDEFDQYKDQNLENLRFGVENTVNGFDGMMSQALTKALIDDDDKDVDRNELLWGGPEQQSGAEIEASALSEVMDWLKRNETASVEVKRAFMHPMLNKMVSSVRHGVLQPEDASRTIHECAALLDLQLLSDLPVTTILVYGLRKGVHPGNLIEAFREFGDIEEAAIAPNQRGFGLVRFKTDKSVDRAMRKYKNSDILVQDVAASVKVLKPSGTGTLNSVT